MKFILPAVLLLVSLFLYCVWCYSRERKYLLNCAAGFFSIFLAAAIQTIAIIPFDGGDSVLSAFGYILGSQLIILGVLHRFGERVNIPIYGLILLLITAGIIYFYYFDNNLFARIYLVNFSMATFFLIAVFRLRKLVWETNTDRILLGCLFLVGMHFFPKVLMTDDTVYRVMPMNAYLDSLYWDATSFWAVILSLVLGAIIILSVGMEIIARLTHDRDTDILTGLLNRRGLINRWNVIAEAKYIRTYSLIICDIDYFKSINDIYGYATGDKVLKQFASILVGFVGERDLAVRLSGEEFLVILHQKSVEQAYILIEKLRHQIEETFFEGLDDTHILTGSFGLTKLHYQEDIWVAIERANKSLSKAKNSGRNRTYTEDVKIPFSYSYEEC